MNRLKMPVWSLACGLIILQMILICDHRSWRVADALMKATIFSPAT